MSRGHHRGTCRSIAVGLVLLSSTVGGRVEALQQAEATTHAYEVAGVDVVHRVRPRSPVVAVRLYLLGGSRQLSEQTEGIEMLFLQTAMNHSRESTGLAGARLLITGTPDWTVAGFTALSEDFGGAWDAWVGPLLGVPPEGPSFTRAKNTLISEARNRTADPQLLAAALAWQSTFRSHPYRFDPWGTEAALGSLNRDDVAGYAREQMVKSRMLLVVVGDVPRDVLSEYVTRTLGTLPEGNYEWETPPPVEKHTPGWRVKNRRLATNYIHGYVLGPPATSSRYHAFEVAANLLSGRLSSEVRGRRSLSYSAGASFHEGALAVAGVWATTTRPLEVYNVLIDQLEWLQTIDQVPGWVLNLYTDQFILDQLASDMTSQGQATALGRAAVLFGDHEVADQYVARLRKVSPRDIRRVALQFMREVQLGYVGEVALLR